MAELTTAQSTPWTVWLESEEGQRCIDPHMLYSDEDRKYLVNRLWCAFTAGLLAGQAAGMIEGASDEPSEAP